MPCCYDGLTARLVEDAGFELTFMTGFGVSAVNGLPDTGLITAEEMSRAALTITSSLRTTLCIGDGDTGYGNEANVMRTVKRYAQMGLDLQGLRTVLSLSGGWRAEDYTTAGMINRDRLMLSAQLSRRVGPKLEARARVDHWRTTFEGATPDYNETTSQLGLAWAAGRHVSLELSAERYQYSSSIAGASLAENRGWLRVRYGEMIRRSVGGQVVPATLP